MSKIKVITTVASWPTALELQFKGLQKFMKEDFELIAFIDTPVDPGPYNLWDKNLRNFAFEFSNQLGAKTYLVPEEIHRERRTLFPNTREFSGQNANLRASDTLQFAFVNEVLNSESQFIFLDNDMFPINNFSFHDKMSPDKILRSVFHSSKARFSNRKVTYIWSGLIFLNSKTMPKKEIWSFDCGRVNGIRVDVSGQTFHWLESIKKLSSMSKVEKIDHLSSLNWDLASMPDYLISDLKDYIIHDNRNLNGNFYSEIYDESFIHFRAGSNWMKEDKTVVEDRINRFSRAYLSSI